MKRSFNIKSLIKILIYTILALFISGTLTCFCADKPTAASVSLKSVPMLGRNYNLSSICTNKKGFSVACPVNGAGLIYSSDGTNWNEKANSYSGIYKIEWDGKEFLGFCPYGGLESSDDGINWKALVAGAVIKGAAKGVIKDKKGTKDILVLIGSRGEIVSSYDMNNFNRIKINFTCDLTDICFNGKFFLAIGKHGTILKSYNGQEWTKSYIGCDLESDSIVWDGKQFICVGEGGKINTSADGTKWNAIPSGTSQWLNSISFYNGCYIVAGNNGTILFSNDSTKWKQLNTGTNADLYGCTWNDKLYCCVGYDNTILTSKDGISWTNKIYRVNSGLNAIAYGNKTYIAVGDKGEIITSDDMKNWHNSMLNSAENIYGIDFDGKKFMAVGEDGTLLSSVNGQNWNENNIIIEGTNYPLTQNLKCIIHAKGKILAAGEDGTIIYSFDGKKWKLAASGTTNEINALSYNGKEFAAVGAEGTILKSNDGLKWNATKANTRNDLNTIYSDNKKYIIGGNSNTLLKGINLDTLKPVTLYAGGNIHWIAYDGTNYFLGGGNGFIGYSSDGESWGNLADCQSGIKNLKASLSDLKASYFFTAKGVTNCTICGSNGSILYGEISGKLEANITKTTEELFANNDKKLVAGDSGSFGDIKDCIYAGSIFMAVGEKSLKTSVDGTNWIEHYNIENNGPFASFTKVYYVDKRYVTIGFNNCLYSDDGSVWKNVNITNMPKNSFMNILSSCCDGKKIYLMVSLSNDTHLITSCDGLKWEDCGKVQNDSGKPLYFFNFLGFAKNRFYGEYGYGTPNIITSTDGKKWTKSGLPFTSNNSSAQISEIKSIDNTIFALTSNGLIGKSADGLNFKFTDCGKGHRFTDIVKFKNKYIVVGDGILISDDGAKWDLINISKLNIESFFNLYSLCASDKKLIAVGSNYPIISSDDGINYSAKVQAQTDLLGITNKGNIFAAVGRAVVSSTDGINWYLRQDPQIHSLYLHTVVCANGKFAASGTINKNGSEVMDTNDLYVSDDGVSWSIQADKSSLASSTLYARDILSNGMNFIKQGDDNILVSADGENWNVQDINISNTKTIKNFFIACVEKVGKSCFVFANTSSDIDILTNIYKTDSAMKNLSCVISEKQMNFGNIVYAFNKYFVYGEDRNQNVYLWTSADGTNWAKQKLATKAFPQSLAYDGKKLILFMAANDSNLYTYYFAYSYDGIKFYKSTPTFTSNNLNISYNGTIYVAAGSQDTIWTSYDGIKWANRTLYYDVAFGGICK